MNGDIIPADILSNNWGYSQIWAAIFVILAWGYYHIGRKRMEYFHTMGSDSFYRSLYSVTSVVQPKELQRVTNGVFTISAATTIKKCETQ